MTIQEAFTTTIKSTDLPHLDVEIILAHALKKSREFVMAHPEQTFSSTQQQKFTKLIARRAKGEPVAYILGHKEFYGLDFIVNKHTLIPRPETELLVEQALELLRSMLRNKLRNMAVVDVGTGSGCIITSITHTVCHSEFISGSKMLKQVQHDNIQFYGTDISKEALKIAKKNARLHGLDKKIKFLHGDLLAPLFKKVNSRNYSHILENMRISSLIITANLPYLSKEIYQNAPVDVKKFEPKSALYSSKVGLSHYEKLLRQIKKLTGGNNLSVTAFFEISPEQKQPLTKIIRSIFPKAKILFTRDLAGKWRICKISL